MNSLKVAIEYGVDDKAVIGYHVRRDVPTVVPALCIEYSSPDCLSSRWTCATSLDMDAVGVPRGMRQKSAMHAGGVERFVSSFDDAMASSCRMMVVVLMVMEVRCCGGVVTSFVWRGLRLGVRANSN